MAQRGAEVDQQPPGQGHRVQGVVGEAQQHRAGGQQARLQAQAPPRRGGRRQELLEDGRMLGPPEQPLGALLAPALPQGQRAGGVQAGQWRANPIAQRALPARPGPRAGATRRSVRRRPAPSSRPSGTSPSHRRHCCRREVLDSDRRRRWHRSWAAAHATPWVAELPFAAGQLTGRAAVAAVSRTNLSVCLRVCSAAWSMNFRRQPAVLFVRYARQACGASIAAGSTASCIGAIRCIAFAAACQPVAGWATSRVRRSRSPTLASATAPPTRPDSSGTAASPRALESGAGWLGPRQAHVNPCGSPRGSPRESPRSRQNL